MRENLYATLDIDINQKRYREVRRNQIANDIRFEYVPLRVHFVNGVGYNNSGNKITLSNDYRFASITLNGEEYKVRVKDIRSTPYQNSKKNGVKFFARTRIKVLLEQRESTNILLKYYYAYYRYILRGREEDKQIVEAYKENSLGEKFLELLNR